MAKNSLPAVFAALFLAGCGGDLGYVSGTITMDGAPLPNARVMFYPQNEGAGSAGRTDKNGYYELYLGRSGKGAVKGEHLVQISTGDEGGGYGDDGSENRGSRETVPAKYNVRTELTATVNGGSNSIDFDLNSEGKIQQPPGS